MGTEAVAVRIVLVDRRTADTRSGQACRRIEARRESDYGIRMDTPWQTLVYSRVLPHLGHAKTFVEVRFKYHKFYAFDTNFDDEIVI
jgi:hypothetical protein